MTEPFLILHKVRGEAAFDIAIKMECPVCKEKWEHEDWVCGECNGDEYWWIIPTSGHRAYPCHHWPIIDVLNNGSGEFGTPTKYPVFMKYWEVPDDLPDHCHYDLDRDKSPIASSDVQLALAKLIKQTPMVRRRRL